MDSDSFEVFVSMIFRDMFALLVFPLSTMVSDFECLHVSCVSLHEYKLLMLFLFFLSLFLWVFVLFYSGYFVFH